MNPPSALHSAMSRDRKPFTYTPGGLDLSEIKSQRMAQRLMRNAMNPGVPEVPVNPANASTTPTVSVALPNFNCLPVQVFPAMPANPKTLLRSRSNPEPRDTPIQRVIPPTFINSTKFENNDNKYKNTPTYSQQVNNNKPTVGFDNGLAATQAYNTSMSNYGSDGYTNRVSTLPASIPTPAFTYTPVLPPITSVIKPVSAPFIPAPVSEPVLPEISYECEYFNIPKAYSESFNEQLPKLEIIEEKDKVPANDNIIVDSKENSLKDETLMVEDVRVEQDNHEDTLVDIPLNESAEEKADIDNEQKEVKIVKKQVTKEQKVQEQNGDQNGDANGEAELTVKLPTKKSGTKTETNVEVERKTLPDGTVEVIKTTTTKTTIDGRTEIRTKTEKTIIPKEEEVEEEVEEEEEEEEEAVVQEVEEKQEEERVEPETVTQTVSTKENGSIVKTEERSETTVAKKVVVIQEIPQPEQSEVEEVEEAEEEEEEVNAEPVTIVLKKQPTPEPKVEAAPVKEDAEEEVDEEEETVEEEIESKKEVVEKEVAQEVEEEVEQEPEAEEEVQEEEVIETKEEVKPVPAQDEEEEEEEEYEEVEVQEAKIEEIKVEKKEEQEEEEEVEEEEEEVKTEAASEETSEEPKEAPVEVEPVQAQETEETKPDVKEEKPQDKQAEFTIPIREPSIPLEKVEDVEIKPIGMAPIITKTHTENTEIITSTIDPSGGLSKQTEYNKIENIVTVNRTTKILDHNYENITQQGIPTVKTYFPPPSIDRISTSPLSSRPYQTSYQPEPTTERRHSLLLERLSMERQLPTDVYQYNNQTYEQTQYDPEPQSEVLTVSNVKPSTITNQQWYQQTKQTNTLYNNTTPASTPVGAPWAQPKSPQPQTQYQPSPQPEPQYQYQPPTQPQYQRGTTPQPQFQRGTTPQRQYQKATTPQPQYQKPSSQPQYQTTYNESLRDSQYQQTTATQPQYQPTYSEPITPANNYSYTSTPSWTGNTPDTTPTQYSYNTDTTQSYQKNTHSSTQQYLSGYVPPPWEQDSSYTSVNNISEKYYQEVPQTNTYNPASSQGWKPTPPPAKFNKTAPLAYVPPAPNQSFVKPVSEPPRQPGRKTYYSEYERRYISVPESTYIPTETKYQPQPDPSPQYYYDNNEPTEAVEPQWRKELREFTEKTSQTQTTEQINVQPPWELDPKYGKTAPATYTPTPTWSQTLRPQSNRQRSFESEFVSQEWPKTNTLGRGRPLSTIGKSVETITERTRGVSVDRYNPNSYQPPAEYPPVQTHTLTTPVPHASYHNPNVPAYHARASAEPRDHPTNYQQRVYRESRASPLQSRSFKYLQWITGTEN